MKLDSAVAMVTGGASGLGEATVRTIVTGGGRVAILDRPNSPGEKLAAELGAKSAIFVAADVTSEDEVKAAVDKTVAAFGKVNVCVNCAGVGIAVRTISKQGPHSLDMFHMVLKVNLLGTFNAIRLAAAAMATNEPNEEKERGVIINTASVAAFDGQIGQAAYSASKGGVVGMTLPAARDLASARIRVCTIAPGLFDTPLLAGLPDEARAALGAQVPHPARLGLPEEYAALAAHIVANPMLNGEVVRLDGALRMPPR